MSNSTSTRLYGGVNRSSAQSEISNCTISTAFICILGFLRFAQEGFSFDTYSVALFGIAVFIQWKFKS